MARSLRRYGRRTARAFARLGRVRIGGSSGGAVMVELFWPDGSCRRAAFHAARDGQRMAALPAALAAHRLAALSQADHHRRHLPVKVAQVPCGSAAPAEGSETADGDLFYLRSLRQYVYVWKTDRRWTGSCRQFVLKLDDGSVHRASFHFRRRR